MSAETRGHGPSRRDFLKGLGATGAGLVAGRAEEGAPAPAPGRSSRPSRKSSLAAAAGMSQLELQSAVFEHIDAFYNRQRRHSGPRDARAGRHQQLRLPLRN